jgi:hypothetical protein
VKIVQEDRVILDIDKELLKGYENATVKITSPELFDKTIYAGYTGIGETKTASFKVKVASNTPIDAKIKILSTRGGYLEKSITIGKK